MTFPYLRSATDVFAWSRQLVHLLNKQERPFSAGPYADDAAAAADGLGIGDDYLDTNGFARRRIV